MRKLRLRQVNVPKASQLARYRARFKLKHA